MEQDDQDKSEEATPYKIRKAREKGQVAKGMDLGFLAVLISFTLYFSIFGADYVDLIASMMSNALSIPITSESQPNIVLQIIEDMALSLAWPLITLFFMTALIVITLEILQIRGIIFSTQPLKPDFSKINPAKGLKRVFSLHTVMETIKNCFKLAGYTAISYFVIEYSIGIFLPYLRDAGDLAEAMESSAFTLLLAFILGASIVTILDQILARRKFRKQMRMSKSELKRETKNREGDPRQKQKRKELHTEFAKQNGGMADIANADVVVTNPHHYAIALRYDELEMQAPIILAKGRNYFARSIKNTAFLHNVFTIENRPLAQMLYRDGQINQPIPEACFNDVASIYLTLRRHQKNETD